MDDPKRQGKSSDPLHNSFATSPSRLGVEAAIRKIHAIPWCQKLLHSPYYGTVSFETRRRKLDSQEHEFFAHTLFTPETIPYCISLARKPNDYGSAPGDHEYDDLATIFMLEYGLNGHKQTLHGGMGPVLLDEVMGLLLDQSTILRKMFFTASMTVQYRRTIPIPTVVLCRALLVGRKGRKVQVRSIIENGKGIVYLEADALFIEAAQKL